MTKIIISLLLMTSVIAKAAPATDVKTNIYQTITGDLLKDCTGVDKKIAVAGFSYSDGRDSHDGGVVAERITTELVKAKKFKVIERKEIEKVFEELKLQRSGAIDTDSAKEIGKMLGADWLVVGTLTELPDKKLELNTRLVSVDSGEIQAATSGNVIKDWMDQYKKMLAEQNKAIENNSKDASAFYERAITYADLKEYDSAIASFSLAITLAPNYSKAFCGRGNAYNKKNEHDKAIEDYSKAIVIDPNYGEAYVERGFAYWGKGEYETEDFSKAIAIDPKWIRVYAYIWIKYMDKGEYDKAIEYSSKAIAIDPKSAWAYVMRGKAYHATFKYDKAIEDFSKAIAIAPKNAAVYNDRGIVYRATGDLEKAAADDEKFLSLSQR